MGVVKSLKMNRIFIIPLLSLFLMLIPVVGVFLTIIVISFWFVIKYDSIFKAINKPETSNIVGIQVLEPKPMINTKKYKINEVDEETLENGR
jgi:hypothetical protein